MAIEVRELVLRMRVTSELRDDLSEKFLTRKEFYEFERRFSRQLDRKLQTAVRESKRSR